MAMLLQGIALIKFYIYKRGFGKFLKYNKERGKINEKKK
jgi:hypothetical protein